jgi:hypothetical protein
MGFNEVVEDIHTAVSQCVTITDSRVDIVLSFYIRLSGHQHRPQLAYVKRRIPIKLKPIASTEHQ